MFTKDDYVDLKSSTIYKDLFSLGGVFPLLLFILEEYLSYNDVNKLEPFDELLDKYTQEPVINNFIIENTHNNIAYKNTKLNFYWDIDNYSLDYIYKGTFFYLIDKEGHNFYLDFNPESKVTYSGISYDGAINFNCEYEYKE